MTYLSPRPTQANSSAASTLLSLLGVVLQDLDIPVGLDCDPISVLGLGGNSWYVLVVDAVCVS